MSSTVINPLVVIVSFVIVFGIVRTTVNLRARRRLKLAQQQAMLRQTGTSAKPAMPESNNKNKRRRQTQLAEKAAKSAESAKYR